MVRETACIYCGGAAGGTREPFQHRKCKSEADGRVKDGVCVACGMAGAAPGCGMWCEGCWASQAPYRGYPGDA